MDDDDDNNDIDGKNVAQVPLWYTHPDQTPTIYPNPTPIPPATWASHSSSHTQYTVQSLNALWYKPLLIE